MVILASTVFTDFDTTLAEALDEVLFEVPYSSAAQFHEYYGSGAPPRGLGMGCAWQTFEVSRLVEERSGVKATYLFSGRHVAAVYQQPDRMTVLDPYLPHRRPIVLRRADAVDGAVTVEADAYPLRVTATGEPTPSKARITWTPSNGTVHSEYSRYRPRLGHYATFRAFTFKPGSVLPAFPPPRGLVKRLLLHAEQNNLSIRVIDREELWMRELVLPFTGRDRADLADPRHLITKDNQGKVSKSGTEGFLRDLDAICRIVSKDPDELVAYLLDAARIYQEIAPVDLEVPDYSVEDE